MLWVAYRRFDGIELITSDPLHKIEMSLYQRLHYDCRPLSIPLPIFKTNNAQNRYIVLPRSNEFFDVQLPFTHLLLTGRGQVREMQRQLDIPTLKSIGFSVGGPEAKDGPFELEIDSFRWLRNVDTSPYAKRSMKTKEEEW